MCEYLTRMLWWAGVWGVWCECVARMRSGSVVLVELLYVVRHEKGKSDIHQVGKALITVHKKHPNMSE